MSALIMLATPVTPAQTDEPTQTQASISYAAARPVLEAFRDDLPPDLRSRSEAELASVWPNWVTRSRADHRTRLDQGDVDAVINLWLFGTSFTSRITLAEATNLGEPAAANIVERRLDDLVAGIGSPGTNERLKFAREVIEREGIDLEASGGRNQARAFLEGAKQRVLMELSNHVRTRESVRDGQKDAAALATVFRDRGLSADTSILPSFGLRQVLQAILSKGGLSFGSVRRVAVVGPGLDFSDLYPQQTIQPFAIIDSLIELGLASSDLQVTTFDVSPRVVQHLRNARQRARGQRSYLLHLPLYHDEQWNPDLLSYWEQMASRIGQRAIPGSDPQVAKRVSLRAVYVHPEVVLSVVPQELDITLERLEPLVRQDRFDLIVATNVLLYYDPFEQALALTNIASMLRPGGFFLSNTAVLSVPGMGSLASLSVAYWPGHGDTFFWYRRE